MKMQATGVGDMKMQMIKNDSINNDDKTNNQTTAIKIFISSAIPDGVDRKLEE